MFSFRDFDDFARLGTPCAVDAGNARWTFSNGATLEVATHGEGIFRLKMHRVTAPDYGLLDTAGHITPAETLDEGWEVRSGNAVLRLGGNSFGVELRHNDKRVLESSTDDHFAGGRRLPGIGLTGNRWTMSFALESGEPVYGLGEQWGPLDKRGQLVDSHVEDALGVNTSEAYKHVPFAWSPSGWGLLVNTPARVRHGVGYPQWSHRSYAMVVDESNLDLLLFAHQAPVDVLAALHGLTGSPAPVPRWSLGVWLSRAYYKDAEEILEAARTMRGEQFPADVITFDGRAWQDTPTRFHFSFDPHRYQDAPGVLKGLAELHYKVACWEYPLISVHSPDYQDMRDKGYFLKNQAGEPYVYQWDTNPSSSPFGDVLTPLPPSSLIDFTNPDAYTFWRDQHRSLFEDGVDVMKVDFGEQVPSDCVAFNGDSGERLHNVYPRLYHQAVWDASKQYFGQDALLWGRASWTGAQKFPVQWGGDPQSDWEGLAACIRGGLSWALSGVPYHATDVGGFYGAHHPDPELYVRWVQQSIFSSHFRFHGVGAREPWTFPQETQECVRWYLQFRYRLMPYLEQLVREAVHDSLPVMRPMPLAFPADPAARGFELQYMFGHSLLICPIVNARGETEIWLPPGEWFELWSGECYRGGRTLEISVPLDRIPVFGREGRAVALGPVVSHTGEIDPSAPVEEIWQFGEVDEKAQSPHAIVSHTTGTWRDEQGRALRVRHFGSSA